MALYTVRKKLSEEPKLTGRWEAGIKPWEYYPGLILLCNNALENHKYGNLSFQEIAFLNRLATTGNPYSSESCGLLEFSVLMS